MNTRLLDSEGGEAANLGFGVHSIKNQAKPSGPISMGISIE